MNSFVYNPPKDPWLDILYEDEDIVVVNKPSGLLSVPGKDPANYDSIICRVREKCPTAGAVHRLDMATSGVMVVAKTKLALSNLGKQFQERKTGKIYYAWVSGAPEMPEGIIKLPLCTDWEKRPMQHVDYENGRPATTHYSVLWTSPEKSFVRLHPLTGRSHQLRVHMKELGHPILGDQLYAPPEIRDMVPRLYLHAAKLTFYHPKSNQKMEFFKEPSFPIPENIILF